MISVPVDTFLKDLASANWTYCYHRVATADTNLEMIKADPSLLFGWSIFNNAAYPIFVKLMNTSLVTAPGANRVHKTIGVAAGTNISQDVSSAIIFDRGLFICITKLLPDNDVTPLVANDCVVDLHYR